MRRWKVNKKFYKKLKLFLKVYKLTRNVCYFLRKLNLNLFKKLKKSTYVNDEKLIKLINVAENSREEFDKNDNRIRLCREKRT